MATMSDIVNDVLYELRLGAGQDVQIHLQEGVVRNVSRLYRTLMKKYTFRDYYFQGSYVTDESTGQINTTIDTVLDKFSNIINVYLENDSVPLPVMPVAVNPALYRRPAITPSGNAKIFTIWPKQERNIVLVSKLYTEADFGINDEVPFYRDMLALGASYQLAEKMGTNDRLTESLKKQFEQLVGIYVMDELHNYALNTNRGQYPTDWYVDEA